MTPEDAIDMLRDLRKTLQAEPGYAGTQEVAGLIGRIAGHAIEQMGALVEERDLLRKALENEIRESGAADNGECPCSNGLLWDHQYDSYGCTDECEDNHERAKAVACWVQHAIDEARATMETERAKEAAADVD